MNRIYASTYLYVPQFLSSVFQFSEYFTSLVNCIYRHIVGELCPQSPPFTMDENKSTKTRCAWGGKVADLSKKKGQEPFFSVGFYCVKFAQEYSVYT